MGLINNIKHKIAVARSVKREKNKEKLRSPHWSSVRDHLLDKVKVCQVCGGNKQLQVHHIEPFNRRPELELELSNLIVLCMGDRDCHLGIGHGGSFDYYNPEIKSDSDVLSQDISKFDEMKSKAKKNRLANKK